MVPEKVVVKDKMQKGYEYFLSEEIGKNFDSEFRPQLSPKKMLELGVFGGKYMTDCREEFPKEWFKKAKLNSKIHEAKLNYFGVNASQSLAIWIKKGWIYAQDPRGWFQWYCRYYMGRRIPEIDKWQIKRWRAMKRHVAQVTKYCQKGDFACRPRQRQALLHWAYDSRKL
jgi:hypothetical protein